MEMICPYCQLLCCVWPQRAECSKAALILSCASAQLLQIDTAPPTPSGTTLGFWTSHGNTWLCGILQRTSVCSFAVLNPGHGLVAGTGFQTFFTQFWSISSPPSYVLLRTPSLFARCHGVTAVPSHGRGSSLLLCTEPNRITFQHYLFE